MLRITRKIKNLFTDEEEFDKNDYRNQLLNAHKENKAFNDKVISTTSIAAVPLLINLSEKLYLSNILIYGLFLLSLTLFVGIFVFQIINNILAIKGCDKGLEENYSISNWFFNKTDKIEMFIYILFFIALCSSFVMFIINLNISINEENSVKNNSTKQERKFQMTEPKQPKRLNESFTPQKSQRPDDKERQNSATPNKNIRPNPTPQQPKENK